MEFDIQEWVKNQARRHRILAFLLGVFGAILFLLQLIDTLQVLGDLPKLPWYLLAALLMLLLWSIARSVASDDQGYYSLAQRLIAIIVSASTAILFIVFGWRQLNQWVNISPSLTRVANYVVFLLIFLALIWLIWAIVRDIRELSIIRILVCEFSEGARREVPSDRTITQKVLERLSEKADTERIRILHHDSVILEHSEALSLGRKAGVAAVLFGYYTTYGNSVVVNLRFQVIREPGLSLPIENQQRVLPFEDLERGELQLFLGRDYTSVVLFFAGLFEYSKENYEEALSLLTKAIEELDIEDQDPQYSLPIESVYLYIGNCQHYLGNDREAESSIQQALKHNPHFGKALHNIGVLRFSREEYDDSLAFFERAINHDSDLHLAYRNRAFAKYAIGMPQEAIRDLEYYLEQNSDDVLAIELLARCYESAGEFETAGEKYGTILAIEPSYHLARLAMARAYVKAGKDELAISVLIPLTSHKGFAQEANAELGAVFLQQRNYEKAIKHYTQALQRSSEKANLRFRRGLAFFYSQQHTAAVKDFSDALLDKPSLSEAIFYRGRANAELGLNLPAKSDFSKFIAMADESDMHKGYAARAMILMKEKSYCEAVSDFESVLNSEHVSEDSEYSKYIRALATAHYSCAYTLARDKANLDTIIVHLKEIRKLDSTIWEKVLLEEHFQEAITLITSMTLDSHEP